MSISIFINYMKKNGFKKTVFKCIEKIYVGINPVFVKHCPFKIKENKIVFSNFNGKGYGYDPKYICEELLKIGGYDLVWAVKDKHVNNGVPDGVRTVRKNSARFYYDMATAKIWVDDVRKGYEVVKRPGQYYMQTWHGSIPLKKIENDAIQSLSDNYINDAKHDSELIDVILSSCKTRSILIKRAFWYDGDILEIGCPRNDIFFHKEKNKLELFKDLGVDGNKRIAVYAPTFRQDESIEAYNLDFDEVKKALKQKFGEEYIWVVRLHPNLEGIDVKATFGEDIIDGSKIQDAQWLFANSNVLISDYSDCLFETAFAGIPVFIYASDIKSYIKERDFYISLDKLPFSISQNTQELVNTILSFDEEDYLESLNKFWNAQGLFENGTATKKAVSWIINKIKE